MAVKPKADFNEERSREIEIIGNIEPGSIASVILEMATLARLKGKDIRIFDIRYATAGMPSKISPWFAWFPGGSWEVMDTGPISGVATEKEQLKNPKVIFLTCAVHCELSEPINS